MSATLIAGALAVTGLSSPVPIASAAAPTISTLDGSTSSSAAASCWEIKQRFPASADGVYWVRTTTLQRPEQFYCDMTTDGGGWVLIGRGREGWTFRDYGQQTPAAVRTTITGPAAFEPAALSMDLVNGLMDGGAVKDLTDGVRLARARNDSGTTWQDVRWHFADLGSWSWAIGGGHRLTSFSIDGVTGTGSNTKDSRVTMSNEVGAGNRAAKNEFVWFTYPWSGHNKNAGFSFGGGISGSNNATTYLYEYATENQAIPFTQMWIRPQLTTPASTPIADTGTPQSTIRPQLSDRPAELAGGVWGVLKTGDTEPQLDTPVLAITTIGDRVYIGGKFAQVRDQSTGQLVNRPYLAAFDRRTGAWIPSFDPKLDGTVWDLDVAGGRLIVAGQFTNIDGVAGTSALAAVDPITGDVDPTWRASLTVSGTTNRPIARAVDVQGNWIYVGGNFTSVAGATVTRSVGRLARVAVSNGNADNQFRPNVGGVPYDVDAAPDGRAYVVGSITSMNGEPRQGMAIVDAVTGALIPGMGVTQFTSATKQYQQAVVAVGAEVWQGGSEHNTHVYRQADYSVLQRYVAADQGGDTQVLVQNNGTVYQGSHGNAWIYRDGTTWPGLTGYTRADVYNWIGAFDTATRMYDPSFVPGLRSAYNEGAWEFHTDVDGCLWFGGDFNGGPFIGGTRQYLEGFSKFCPADSTAPSVPRTPTASSVTGGGVQVKWGSSTDNAPAAFGYEVLRNDRVVSGLVYGSTFVDPAGQSGDRYFVRAVDAAGNRSASTPVFVATDAVGPTVPTNVVAAALPDASIDVTWTASVDDVGVASYRILRSGVVVREVPGSDTKVNLVGLGLGAHSLQVVAVDTNGNVSVPSPTVTVTVASTDTEPPPTSVLPVPDTTNPTTPKNPTATATPEGNVAVAWTASTDNVGIASYTVFRNGVSVTTVPGTVTSALLTTLGAGTHYIQLQAVDAAGNVSYRTASAVVTVAASTTTTTQPPTTTVAVSTTTQPPTTTVTPTVPATSAAPATTAPTTTAPTTTAPATTVAPATTTVGTAPPGSSDTVRPKVPTNLVVTTTGDGSIDVAWTASFDNVGVNTYRVTRNSVGVAVVPGTQTSTKVLGLGPGKHYIQVYAIDAAGNESVRTASVIITL